MTDTWSKIAHSPLQNFPPLHFLFIFVFNINGIILRSLVFIYLYILDYGCLAQDCAQPIGCTCPPSKLYPHASLISPNDDCRCYDTVVNYFCPGASLPFHLSLPSFQLLPYFFLPSFLTYFQSSLIIIKLLEFTHEF